MVDTTGNTVNPLITSFDQLSIHLVPSENLKSIGYEWDEEDYPVCTEEFEYGTDFEYIPEITPTTEKIALFEPYKIVDPIAGGIMIRCNVWFDKANGKILGFDTNLATDNLEKVDGDWIKKEVYFEIPSEIDGVKVQSIGSFINWDRNIGTYDKIIIPDGITLDEYAFTRTPRTTTLEIGDNVTAGYNSLPSYKNIVVGENFVFKGFYASKGGSMSSKLPEIIYNDELLAIELSYNEDEDITVESEGYYHSVTYASGMNIVDEVPTKTLTVADDIMFIDPRLGRLNRRFVISENNPNYTSIDGVLYNKDVTELISVPIGVEELTIPDTVTKIGDHALEYNNALKSITFPEGVKDFGHYAFRHLSNIEYVRFEGYVPKSFKAISCSEFEIFSAKTTPTERIDHIVTDTAIVINQTEYENGIIAAFYDEGGHLLEVKTNGLEFEIPPLADTYSLMIWDENMKPLTVKEHGEI